MSIFFKKIINSSLLFSVVVVWFLSYSKVPFIFFQQDELMGFGLFILKGANMLYSGFGFQDVVHFVPVTMSLSYSLFNFFGLNHLPYNIIGLFFHTINGLLIYLIGQKIFKSKIYSILTVILFFSCSAGSELVMWPVINLNTISLSFSLIAVNILISSSTKNNNIKIDKYILISLMFLLAVFSVEYAAGLILIIPVTGFLLDTKNNFVNKLKQQIPFYITVFGYLSLRFLPAFLAKNVTSLSTVTNISLFERMSGIIRLPFAYISQSFLGQGILIDISQFISSTFFGNTTNMQFAESYIYKYVAVVVGLFISISLIYITNLHKKNIYSKYLVIFLLFLIFSSLPFGLVPGKPFSIVPSRYLYFGGVGYAFLITLMLSLQKNKVYLVILGILLIINGTYINHKKSQSLYEIGKQRLEILNIIKNKYPVLPEKVVFLTTSNRSYYGLPESEKILPFQSGLGHTLFLWYYSGENFSREFFKNEFLWSILSEGYKDINNQGFGYFRDYQNLKKSVSVNKLETESIIAFKWDYYTSNLIDITSEVRGKIKNEK